MNKNGAPASQPAGQQDAGAPFSKETVLDAQLSSLLNRSEFPRSGRYDLQWIINHQMGLNALWLTEWLGQGMNL